MTWEKKRREARSPFFKFLQRGGEEREKVTEYGSG